MAAASSSTCSQTDNRQKRKRKRSKVLVAPETATAVNTDTTVQILDEETCYVRAADMTVGETIKKNSVAEVIYRKEGEKDPHVFHTGTVEILHFDSDDEQMIVCWCYSHQDILDQYNDPIQIARMKRLLAESGIAEHDEVFSDHFETIPISSFVCGKDSALIQPYRLVKGKLTEIKLNMDVVQGAENTLNKEEKEFRDFLYSQEDYMLETTFGLRLAVVLKKFDVTLSDDLLLLRAEHGYQVTYTNAESKSVKCDICGKDRQSRTYYIRHCNKMNHILHTMKCDRECYIAFLRYDILISMIDTARSSATAARMPASNIRKFYEVVHRMMTTQAERVSAPLAYTVSDDEDDDDTDNKDQKE